jgi:hypothetical protein
MNWLFLSEALAQRPPTKKPPTYSVVDKIFSYQPQTLAGLAIQARAITIRWSEMWGDEPDHDETRTEFIESVCALTGVTPVPHEVVQS